MAADACDIRVLHRVEEFAAIKDQWNGLLEQDDGGTYFQSYGFLSAWWREFGECRDLAVVCVFVGNSLVGGAALQGVEKRIVGVKTRVLQFAGMPNDILRPTILVPREDTGILRSVLSGIEALPGGWQLIRLEELPSNAWFTPHLQAWAEERRLGFCRRPFHACPYLAKDGTWESYLESKSKKFARRIRYLDRRLKKVGKVTFESESRSSDPAGFVEIFSRIEKKSWKSGKSAAVSSDERYRRLYNFLLGGDGEEYGQGHAFVLKIDSRPVAATFGVSWRGKYYALQIAHDKEFDRYSPGFLLEAREMQWFFSNPGLQCYEFLGGEVFSKRRWTGSAVATDLVIIHTGGTRLALYTYLKFRVLPPLKKFFRRTWRDRVAPIAPFVTD